MSGIRYLFYVDIKFFTQLRIGAQHHFHLNFFFLKIGIYPKRISKEFAIAGWKNNIGGIERQKLAVAEFSIDIYVIVSAFFQAVCV